MPASIRRISSGDGDLLRVVRLTALLDSPSAFGSAYAAEARLTAEDWSVRARAGAAGPDHSTFFALVDDRVVGLAGGYRADPNTTAVELVSMWCDPEVRRAGVGRALVNAVIEWAELTGASSVDLWVTVGNDAARALYTSLGFRDTGDVAPLPSDPCKDEIRMTRSVGH